MRIAITGSNGFIGSELVSHFLGKGDEVIMLQRKIPAVLPAGATFQQYDLNKPGALLLPENTDVLIHTAYIPYTVGGYASEKNIEGTLALYNLCLSKGIYFLFFSSMSAHANALSQYGKHKFAIEQLLDKDKCLVLRPGLVIGKRGLFSRIYQSLKKMPLAVLVNGGNQPVQPVYINDLVKATDQCILQHRTGLYTVAINKVYTMRRLFAAIARKAGVRPVFISVPYWLVEAGLKTITTLHLPFPVSEENLLGMKQLIATDTSADIKALDITLLDLDECLARL